MLSSVWIFVQRHVIGKFLKYLGGYLVGRAAKSVGNKIIDTVVGDKREWECVSCDAQFSRQFLYDGYWLARRTCPSCESVNTLARRPPEERVVQRVEAWWNNRISRWLPFTAEAAI